MGAPSSLSPALPKLTRFDVKRSIGEGGMGVVYEAVDRETHARVALKMLRRLEGETVLRLKGEFRALQDIEHPNLVRLGELTCDDGAWFFTMELVEGTDLVDWVGRTRGHARLRDAFTQLAHAIGALHAAGKVHRDVKPSNVLVDAQGRVVLLDFGLVRDAEEAPPEDEDVVVGTIAYMAPEQGAGEDVGPPADWYALGAILYQCLTGRRPFEGSGTDVLARKLTEDPPRPSSLRRGIPRDLDELCVRLLSREPSERPSSADVLRALHAPHADGVRGSMTPPPPPAAPGAPPFVGRASELAALRAAFERARRSAVTVVVEGESGIGKSAVVRRFLRERVDAGDALVLAGRCYEREDLPFKAIDGVIDSVSRQLGLRPVGAIRAVFPPSSAILAHTFPVLRRLPGVEVAPLAKGAAQESRGALFGAVRELFARLAAERSLIVSIDDLQWADADSLALIAEILRPPSPPLLFVATARAAATPRAPGAVPFGLPGAVEVLPLSRLDAAEGLELVRALGGAMPDATAERIAKEAAGHPLFVDELVRHALVAASEGSEHLALDDALVARAARLEPQARALLDVVTVAGVALAQEIARRASSISVDDLPSRVQALRAAHLARTQGWRGEDAIEPYHDRVREALVASLTEDARRGVHARVARALESADTRDADALSTHWLAAGESGKAGTYARIAGDQARDALAFDHAAHLYERALSLAPLTDDARQALRVDLAETLANGGRGREAAKAFFDAASASTAADVALDLRRRASEELLNAGRLDEGDAALADVLREVGLSLPHSPLASLVRLLLFRMLLVVRGLKFRERQASTIPAQALTRVDACNGVGRMLSVVDPIRGSYFQTRALVEALGVGEPSRIARALAVEAAYASFSGPRNGPHADALLARAGEIATRAESPLVNALVHTATGFCQFLRGRFPDAVGWSDRASSIIREGAPGGYWDARTAEHCALWSTGWMGDLESLARRVELGIRESEQRGDLYAGATLRTGVMNLASLRHGDVPASRERVAEAARRWTPRGYHMQHYWAMLATAQLDLYEGKAREAEERVRREWSSIARALIFEIGVVRLEALHLRGRTLLARAEQTQGSERATLLRAAERDARRLERTRWAIATPMAHALRAGARSLRGDEGAAAIHLEAAVRGFDDVAMSLHAMSARFTLGHLRGGDAGRADVRTAEAWMTAMSVASAARMSALFNPGFAASG